MSMPLVSILIPNRNHSSYLDECIRSAMDQTYKNIEIIVCDNCSDDDSYEVIKKYIKMGVILNKNPVNIFNYNYRMLAQLCNGEFFILLCADDILKPDFIEKAMNVMLKNKSIGYLHCERDYIDENGEIIELSPFFSCSFQVAGENMLPIYMLTDVAQASQCLIRKDAFDSVGGHDTETDHSNIDRELWFRLSMKYDYAYLRDKLSYIRIHSSSETNRVSKNFVHPLSIYVMIKGFLEWGKLNGYTEVLERESLAFSRLANDILDQAEQLIKLVDLVNAKRYMILSELVFKDVKDSIKYKKCIEMIEHGCYEDTLYCKDIRINDRIRNYNPPKNFKLIMECTDYEKGL